MDLLSTIRDLGVADPAADATGERTVRAALAREMEKVAIAEQPQRSRPPRRSRRSRPRLRVTLPTLALTAAAAAAVVVVSTGSAGGSHASPVIGGGGPVVHGQDTAYIIRRVRAAVAGTGPNVVMEATDSVTSTSGAAVGDTTTLWSYSDPQTGILYSRAEETSAAGAALGTSEVVVDTPTGNGNVHFQYTDLDPARQIYDVRSNNGSAPPGIATAQQVRQELSSGAATADGTTTVDGQPVTKLTFQASPYTDTLYVNSQTYEPVQAQVVGPQDAHDASAGTDTTTSNYLPVTPANIAQAKLAQIPAGYTQVSQTALLSAEK